MRKIRNRQGWKRSIKNTIITILTLIHMPIIMFHILPGWWGTEGENIFSIIYGKKNRGENRSF